MTAPQITYNPTVADPSLKDVLDAHRTEIFFNLNCHALATVQSFDPVKQTVTAMVSYQKTYFDRTADGSYQPVLVSYPILIDCPVVVVSGGQGAITFPIAAGDPCLVLFNDRDMNNWFSGATTGPVASSRAHAFADAIVLIGVRPPATALANYNPTDVVLSNGQASLAVLGPNSGLGTAGNFLITNANAQSLGALLQSLITAIKNLVVAPSTLAITPASIIAPGGGGPCSGSGAVNVGTGAIDSSSQTTLQNIATQLQGLLS